MLSSLFGDLRNLKKPGHDDSESHADEDAGFAATKIMESVATEVNDQGRMVDNSLVNLEVTGSPAQAIRDHFAATRADLDTATRMLSLYDPSGIWAASVIKALSDASGRPIERLHLRERGTLRTLAMIERTTIERRNEDNLRIYHADVRVPGQSNSAVSQALMERSHMTAVIVGAMAPHAIDDMLKALLSAVTDANWRCPTLLFMLPPNAVWIANRVGMIAWPERLHVQVLNESLTSASAVWNALLGQWNRVKREPTWAPPEVDAVGALEGFQIKVADLSASASAPLSDVLVAARQSPVRRHALDSAAASKTVSMIGALEGVLGCAIVDSSTGLLIAQQGHDDHSLPLGLAAAAGAKVLRAHQTSGRDLGFSQPVEEIITSAGARHHVLRTLSRHPGLFLFAVLDKHRTNLALTRYKLTEAEQGLS
jgi:hypothetical protein